MRHRLRPVGPEFVRTAPLRLVFVAEAAAPPEVVFKALADVEGWPRWYRQVAAARSTGDGAGREIRLRGGVRFAETVMAADPGERYAYRVDETNAPGLRALLEEWRLVPSVSGTGSLVRYTFAVDAVAPVRGALWLLRPGLRRAFRDAVRALDGLRSA
ncbi:SRPBCC family protein [Streptomyces cuspidosporus]|uniref:SRPBCC family protein n=1 Tax=Streptomyces cuspidosporus TaxID=66882 RepID=UPI0031FC4732